MSILRLMSPRGNEDVNYAVIYALAQMNIKDKEIIYLIRNYLNSERRLERIYAFEIILDSKIQYPELEEDLQKRLRDTHNITSTAAMALCNRAGIKLKETYMALAIAIEKRLRQTTSNTDYLNYLLQTTLKKHKPQDLNVLNSVERIINRKIDDLNPVNDFAHSKCKI